MPSESSEGQKGTPACFNEQCVLLGSKSMGGKFGCFQKAAYQNILGTQQSHFLLF